METDNDMVLIPAGDFVMGSQFGYLEERPQITKTNSEFLMDRCAVTNAEFAIFVAETNYLTSAEQSLSREEFPDMPEAFFTVGSLVFHMTEGPVPFDDPSIWWRLIAGANWRHPEGPDSDLTGRARHPVVHISLLDAMAYAEWAGKSLPNEAEWECAARGGSSQEYPWGKTYDPDRDQRANTWIGEFPWKNDHHGTGPFSMPVDAFDPNAFGLMNMIGNVWEWTCTPFENTHATSNCCTPPTQENAPEIYTMKGGSFLCAPSYCQRYRPAARIPQEKRTSTNHSGFRCIQK